MKLRSLVEGLKKELDTLVPSSYKNPYEDEDYEDLEKDPVTGLPKMSPPEKDPKKYANWQKNGGLDGGPKERF